MFGVDTSELIIVAVLALLFIGPKELPTAMRHVGRWIGKIRAMARGFTSGFEEIVREAELEEMERKWREENDRIMREFPAIPAQMEQAHADRPEIGEPQLEQMTPDPEETDEPGLPLPMPDERRELP